MSNQVRYVFVLMLENRSFDHMLGLSYISGQDAESGHVTKINGVQLYNVSTLQLARSLNAKSLGGIARTKGWSWPSGETIGLRQVITANLFDGGVYGAIGNADYAMPSDPVHEFPDIVTQICGPAITAHPGPYPQPINTGFVASYVKSDPENAGNPGEIMKCYSPAQLPVLNTLASEFAVCDNWYASLPGPTWPNRFFSHAASSGGLDHSPSTAQIAGWETSPGGGFSFENGTIFDRLSQKGLNWRIYVQELNTGDEFPITLALKGVHWPDSHNYSSFDSDISQPGYSVSYTVIEPSYDVLKDYRCGTSQHPINDVTRGESLIKNVYETIRNSPVWNSSLLIITWDEHGGFFDHVIPPRATPPGDRNSSDDNNQYGFQFDQYGVRVPAIVVSPLIPRNIIDHRLYDHSSIPATLEAAFGLPPLTARDARANNVLALATLSSPRGDAPLTLPVPVQSGVGGCGAVSFADELVEAKPTVSGTSVSRPTASIDEGKLPGFVHCALRVDLQLSPPAEKNAILTQVASLRTRADAAKYMEQVRQKLRAARAATPNPKE